MGSFLGDEVAAVQLVAAESLGFLVPEAGDVIWWSEPVLAPDHKGWTADFVAGVGPAAWRGFHEVGRPDHTNYQRQPSLVLGGRGQGDNVTRADGLGDHVASCTSLSCR